jgi:hypothetical protein
MPNVKAQSSNKYQITNLTLKFHLIFGFWHLTFLVDIWILTFENDG